MRDVSGRGPLALRACEQFREMIQLRVYAFMPLAGAIEDASISRQMISIFPDRPMLKIYHDTYDREIALTINY